MATAWTVPIHGGPVDVALVGGKGAGLCRLAELGYPVPRGFCVTTAAYRRTVGPRALGPTNAAELRERIRGVQFPSAIREAVAAAHATLCQSDGERLVVRSSATFEDARDGSFAGQAESYLDVTGLDSLFDHIRKCWASLFGDESLLYRLRSAPEDVPPEMAVVVQRLIPADSAGVLFTTNPLNGRPEELLVCSAFGLGASVVGGRAADTYALDKRSGAVVERHLGDKNDMLQVSGARGLVHTPVAPRRAGADSLSEEQLRELARLARGIERACAEPQDVEWAFADGRLWLLQCRPVTAGRGLAGRGAGRPEVWSNVNVGEALPGVGTPMTWSVARAFSRRGIERAFGSLGLSVPPDYEFIGSFRGRIFLNLTQFVSIMSQIPYFPPDRLLRIAGGGGLGSLEGMYEPRSSTAFVLHLPLTLPRMAASQVLMPLLSKGSSAWFDRYRERFFETDLESLEDPALLDTLDRFTKVFNRVGTVMLSAASNALSSYIAVIALLRRWGGEDAAELQERLFVGLSSVRSAAPGLALLRIAHQVRRSERLVTLFETTEPQDLLARLDESPEGLALRADLERFLAEHGRRAPREAELSTPRWEEEPGFLLGVLRAHVRNPRLRRAEAVLAEQAAVRRKATDEVRRRMPTAYRPVFDAALALAHDAARRRELLRDHVVDTLAIYRRLLLEIGRRMTALGLAARRDDVFFLTVQEARGWLVERVHPERNAVDRAKDLPLRVAARRAAHEAFCAAPDPPDTFTLNAGELVAEERAEELADTDVLQGLPGSPGRVTGVARVILDPKDGGELRPGEILVAPFTDVGWTPLFLVAGGVVMDMGGALSHSCVVAREYGLPAVVNVKRGTQRIRSGQRVTVDGDAGRVYLRDPETP